jgi:hypothetical protein
MTNAKLLQRRASLEVAAHDIVEVMPRAGRVRWRLLPARTWRARASRAWATVLLIAFLTGGCGGAEWRKLEIDSPYRVPKALTISVSSQPEQREPAQVLALALADELKSRGIAAVIVPPAGGAAEVNIELYRWDTLPKGFSWTRPGSAKGIVAVTVDTATIGVRGEVSGWKNAGGTINDAARSAGHLIGRAIGTGPERQGTAAR